MVGVRRSRAVVASAAIALSGAGADASLASSDSELAESPQVLSGATAQPVGRYGPELLPDHRLSFTVRDGVIRSFSIPWAIGCTAWNTTRRRRRCWTAR